MLDYIFEIKLDLIIDNGEILKIYQGNREQIPIKFQKPSKKDIKYYNESKIKDTKLGTSFVVVMQCKNRR
jgi:hypothetical protein